MPTIECSLTDTNRFADVPAEDLGFIISYVYVIFDSYATETSARIYSIPNNFVCETLSNCWVLQKRIYEIDAGLNAGNHSGFE